MTAAWAGGAGGGRDRARLTGMSGCIATSGVAIEKSEAPAEMPRPTPSVAYTFRMCPTTPSSRLSHVNAHNHAYTEADYIADICAYASAYTSASSADVPSASYVEPH